MPPSPGAEQEQTPLQTQRNAQNSVMIGASELPDLPVWQRIVVVLVLILGRWVYDVAPERYHPFNYHPGVVLIAAGVMLIGPVRRWVLHILDLIRRPTRGNAIRAAAIIALVSGLFLYACARWHGGEFILYFHDEHSFMLQLQALMRGRLWMPPIPEPLRDFVESFNMMVYPKYGSIYFPGHGTSLRSIHANRLALVDRSAGDHVAGARGALSADHAADRRRGRGAGCSPRPGLRAVSDRVAHDALAAGPDSFPDAADARLSAAGGAIGRSSGRVGSDCWQAGRASFGRPTRCAWSCRSASECCWTCAANPDGGGRARCW